jgi:hypothetical protein
MAIVEQSRFDATQREVRNYDLAILLGYSGFAFLLLITIYFGCMSSGTAPGELATMTAFP